MEERPVRLTRSAGRPALADVSNQLGKRKFVSVSSNSATGTQNENDEGKGIGKALFPGKDFVGVKGKKIVFEFGGKGDGPVLKAKAIVGSSDLPHHQNSRFGNSQVNTCALGIGGTKFTTPVNPSAPAGNVVIDLSNGDPTSTKPTLVGGSMPSRESQKCDFDGTPAAGMDILKTCSCSFCLKAAYIWSDLQYQDTKGRIAALKRSRKDVRSVIDKSCSYAGFGKSVLGSSNKPTKLEHDLMGQWRSLFLHTEDVLIRESSQLQSSLLSLKNLRGSCKSDLEKTSATSSHS